MNSTLAPQAQVPGPLTLGNAVLSCPPRFTPSHTPGEGQWLMWPHLLQEGRSEGATLAAEKKVHFAMGSQEVIKHIISGVQKQ